MTDLNPFFSGAIKVKDLMVYILSLRWFFKSAEGATHDNDISEVDAEFEEWLESSRGKRSESDSWLSDVMTRQTGKEGEGWNNQFKH